MTIRVLETSFKQLLSLRGRITLNSEQGLVGTPYNPLNVETLQECFISAKTVAYLNGICADQMLHVYSTDPSPRLFFNGNEYNFLFIDDVVENKDQLNSISFVLIRNVPSSLMDGSALKLRDVPIYYELPK